MQDLSSMRCQLRRPNQGVYVSTQTVSTSFVQDQKHASRSDKYVQVQPLAIASRFIDQGFTHGHTKTGRARKVENENHQVTITRLFRDDVDLKALCGLNSTYDILFRNAHLGGALEFRAGFFRGFCANQWNSGHGVTSIKVRHTGDCLDQIDRIIPQLVAQRDEILETIRLMAARTVNQAEALQILQACANLRLAQTENVENVHLRLIQPRRIQDAAPTLFNVLNVGQEYAQGGVDQNGTRYGLQYTTKTVNDQGQTVVRNCQVKALNSQSQGAFDLTGSIWDFGTAFLKAA